jgi:hypothetical protein
MSPPTFLDVLRSEVAKLALYQHSCQEVQSSYNALSIKELHLHPAVGLLPQ